MNESDWNSVIWILVVVLIVMVTLSSCGHYQPPGENLWKMV